MKLLLVLVVKHEKALVCVGGGLGIYKPNRSLLLGLLVGYSSEVTHYTSEIYLGRSQLVLEQECFKNILKYVIYFSSFTEKKVLSFSLFVFS